jgi:hypothetical protein
MQSATNLNDNTYNTQTHTIRQKDDRIRLTIPFRKTKVTNNGARRELLWVVPALGPAEWKIMLSNIH